MNAPFWSSAYFIYAISNQILVLMLHDSAALLEIVEGLTIYIGGIHESAPTCLLMW